MHCRLFALALAVAALQAGPAYAALILNTSTGSVSGANASLGSVKGANASLGSVSGATASTSSGSASSPTQLITAEDFLVQKVCFKKGDASKTALAVDPYTCAPENRRALRVGEILPYRKHDWKQANDTSYNPHGFQYSDSFPIADRAGKLLYISSMQFAEGATLTYTAQNTPYFNPDGYNVLTTGASWANFAGTKDPSGAAQSFYGPKCQRDKSWLLFPLNTKFTNASTIAELMLIREGQSCTNTTRFDKSLLEYAHLPQFTYTSNKTLRTVKATHWGTASVEETGKYPGAGFEVVYFTDLYGLTRWEGWTRKQDGGTPIAAPYCNGPSEQVRDGTTWIRIGCRDWTYITTRTQANTPIRYSPYSLKLDAPFSPPNLLNDSDFTQWTNAWKRTEGTKLVHWAIQTDPKSYRKNLAFACVSRCLSNQIFQTVPVGNITGKTTVNFGSQGWVDSGNAYANHVIVQLDAKGQVLRQDNLRAAYTTDPKGQYSRSVALDPKTKSITYALYPLQTGLGYHLANSWLVLQ